MTPLAGHYILTAEQTRNAEANAIAAGTTAAAPMTLAGREIAVAVQRLAGAHPVLILCGPGNNGGDGYVAAQALKAAGVDVRVAALTAPKTPDTKAARAAWTGPVEPFESAEPAPVLVDALFGIGLDRALDDSTADRLADLAGGADLKIAVDLPSGVDSDTGALLGLPYWADVTLALGTPKPAHLLGDAAPRCGHVRVLDIGIGMFANGIAAVPRRPFLLRAPSADAHKYSRGMVAVIGGTMPGAAELAAHAALAAGAGYALLLADGTTTVPHAIVRRPYDAAALDDRRIGAILVGPGLGRDATAADKLDAALASAATLVIDGDALQLLDEPRRARIRQRSAPTILTPHAGEFDALFGASPANRIVRAREAADQTGAAIVFKGSSTVIAPPDGSVWVTEPASSWLSTAGTGDVLAGTIAAILAGQPGPMLPMLLSAALTDAVWLHGAAAAWLRGPFLADDLIPALSAARGAL